MFRLTRDGITPPELEDSSSGGFVTFEGVVRPLNDGRQVEAIEYEAFEPLAISEGEAIIAEAVGRYGLNLAICTHRLGRLGVGEIAVRIDVGAAHRAEAFAGCRFVIDELKRRVPIWKKEYYTDGDSDWILGQEGTRGDAEPGAREERPH